MDAYRRSLLGCLWIGLALFAVASSAGAADVDIRLTDREGATVRSGVLLRATGNLTPEIRSWMRQGAHRVMSGNDGRALFSGVPSGTYRISLYALSRRDLLTPKRNPLHPAPMVTVRPEDQTLQVPIELWPFLTLRAFLQLPIDQFNGFTLNATHLAGGKSIQLPFPKDRNEIETRLPYGTWTVSVTPRPGFLLTGLDVDGQAVAGSRALLELDRSSSGPYVTFSFAAPAKVEGNVIKTGGVLEPVSIRATLLQPGPWWQAAEQRGVALPDRVEAMPDDQGDYAMYLMDGLWTLEPVAPGLKSSNPESRRLALEPGDEVVADFTVELEKQGDADSVLAVLVQTDPPTPRRYGATDPEYQGAVVAEGSPDQILWSGPSRHRSLRIPGLADGSYVVAAAHADFVEGRLALPHHRAGKKPDRRPVIVLRQGTVFEMLAEDAQGERLSGAELHIERLDELPELVVRQADILAAKTERRGETDRSGRLRLTGFYGGAYRLQASLAGLRGSQGHVELRRPGGRWQRDLELTVEDDEIVGIEAREKPAAELQAKLICADAHRLPDTVSYRVLDAAAPQGPPVLAADSVLLDEAEGHQLTVGPLDSGTWLLGLRPEGFERWTYAYGVHAPELAEGIWIDGSGLADSGGRRVVELGMLDVVCGPVVHLIGETASGPPFPDPGSVDVQVRLLDPADPEKTFQPPAAAPIDQGFELQALPSAELILEITLGHAHFLPTTELRWSIPMTLHKGSFDELVLEIDPLGGALSLKGPSAGLYRLRPDDETWTRRARPEPRFVDHQPPVTEIPSLEPGPWLLELCPAGDPACDEPVASKPVRIQAGETLRLESPFPR